ncbi:hypothetical protein L1887_30160 [Cichorium endivia]|nr:hypothetical protein L1887_30160 [Cichorium endivia]
MSSKVKEPNYTVATTWPQFPFLFKSLPNSQITFISVVFSLYSNLNSICSSNQISDMGSFENQVKERAEELKKIFTKGAKIVGDSCKKGWHKVKHLRK